MVKQFIIRNTNLHIIHYLTIHYAIYLIYFKKYLVLSKICVYLSVGGHSIDDRAKTTGHTENRIE